MYRNYTQPEGRKSPPLTKEGRRGSKMGSGGSSLKGGGFDILQAPKKKKKKKKKKNKRQTRGGRNKLKSHQLGKTGYSPAFKVTDEGEGGRRGL